MFATALQVALEMVMKNHVYTFDNQVRLQRAGGPIGLELTGNIAQVFMIWWSRELNSRCAILRLEVWLYKCYVDNVNIVCKAIEAGTGYENGQLTTTAIPTREEAESLP